MHFGPRYIQTDVVGRFINSEGGPGSNIPGDLVSQSVCHMAKCSIWVLSMVCWQGGRMKCF